MRAKVTVEFDNPNVIIKATTGSLEWKTCGESIGRNVQAAVDATRVDVLEQLEMLKAAPVQTKRGPGRPRKNSDD